MKIVVTGGAGFMGSNFIHYLLRTYPDYRVINFDKLTYAGNLENLSDIDQDPRYEFVKGDIADPRAVRAVLAKGPDAIVNFAAESHVDRSVHDPKGFITTDVLGTYELLEAARQHGIKRYVQISTDEVYGAVHEGRSTEQSPMAPRSPYSAAKASADHLVEAYVATYGLPAMITRSVNNFGPYQYPEKLFPLFITNLIEGKKVPVYGDGKQVREWIYVEDHSRAVDAVLHRGRTGEIYNIGTGENHENIEITRLLLQALALHEDRIEHVKDRPGHDTRYALDSTKLRAELTWSPETTFSDGIQQTVAWYQANASWWQRIKSGAYREYYERQYGQR